MKTTLDLVNAILGNLMVVPKTQNCLMGRTKWDFEIQSLTVLYMKTTLDFVNTILGNLMVVPKTQNCLMGKTKWDFEIQV